jgi:aminopeptidase N
MAGLALITPEVGNAGGLARETAAARASQVEGLSYGYWLSLPASGPEFSGRATIRFRLKEKAGKVASTLPLDLRASRIDSVVLNGESWDAARIRARTLRDSEQLVLEIEELKPGENRLEISYQATWGQPGFGLQRWQQQGAAPGQASPVYLTGTFQPFSAHWVFPVFDQPDLKGVMELTVESPREWTVVSATREREVQVRGGRSQWVFPPTPPLSPHGFSLHAGDFKVLAREMDGVGFRLLFRRSEEKKVVPQEWWDLLGRGLRFYQARFGYPFPATKLDVVFGPEVPGESNEAAGTLVLDESVLSASVELQRLEGLQGLAHLWFGQLVTMRWWNGLWLKEALSGFAARWAVEEAFGDSRSWLRFAAGPGSDALWADRNPAAHPVDVSVKESDEAIANVDVLTREKGMGILRQLFFWVGEEAFQEALQRYFARYAHRSVTLADFAKVIEESADLKESFWRRPWLQAPGHPVWQVEWSCSERDGHRLLDRLVVLQKGIPLRWSRLRLALLGVPEESELRPRRKGRRAKSPVPVSASSGAGPRWVELKAVGAVTSVPGIEGLVCPLGVLVDPEGELFAETRLDPATDTLLRRGGEQVLWKDPGVRIRVWQARADAVASGEAALRPFLELLEKELLRETDSEVRQFLGRLAFGGPGGSSGERRLGVLQGLLPVARGEVGGRLLRALGKDLAGKGPVWWRRLAQARTETASSQGLSPLESADWAAVSPSAPGTSETLQEEAAERLAARAFWREGTSEFEGRFGQWLAGAVQAVSAGTGFDGDEERAEDLAEVLWPLGCRSGGDAVAILPEESLRLRRIRAHLRWEGDLCARLRKGA